MNVGLGPKERHALRPDLSECILEDRVLQAIEPGLYPSAFMAVNSASNQIIVPGTSSPSGGGSGGGSVIPGPSFYFILLGSNASSVSTGSRVGGSVSLYSIANLRTLPAGAMVHTISGAASLNGGGGGGSVSSGGGGGDSGNAGGISNFGGYGASFSSGYGFALSSGNNYGMFSGTGVTSTLGSVPVHTYGGGGDAMAPQDGENGNGNGNGNGNYPNENVRPIPGAEPNMMPGYGPQGPNSKFYDTLLGKNPGKIGVQTQTGVQTGGVQSGP